MGVYIKGLNMPGVNDFPFEAFFRCINNTNMKFVIKKDGEEQVYEVVEVPEPHGRLIDADVAKLNITASGTTQYTMREMGGNK